MTMCRLAIKFADFGCFQLLRGRARLASAGSVLAAIAATGTFCDYAVAAEILSNNNGIGVPLASDSAPDNQGELSDVFGSRWPSPAHGFTFGVDGIPKPDSVPAKGSTDSNYTLSGHPRAGAELARALSQKGIITADAKESGASECGPSDLSAEIVKALVDSAAEKHGVDVTFAEAVAWSESGFGRSRNSSKGARGAMQLMPATAVELGVRDVCDPADNIDGGVRHLRAMLDEFGNPLLAAAAYNAGAEAIYRYGGIPPYPETVSFVARIVNFTLGLKPPKGHVRAKGGQANETAADAEVGVIIAQKPGVFVGGVMQF